MKATQNKMARQMARMMVRKMARLAELGQWEKEMKLRIVQLMKMVKMEVERKEKTRTMVMKNLSSHAPRMPIHVIRVG